MEATTVLNSNKMSSAKQQVDGDDEHPKATPLKRRRRRRRKSAGGDHHRHDDNSNNSKGHVSFGESYELQTISETTTMPSEHLPQILLFNGDCNNSRKSSNNTTRASSSTTYHPHSTETSFPATSLPPSSSSFSDNKKKPPSSSRHQRRTVVVAAPRNDDNTITMPKSAAASSSSFITVVADVHAAKDNAVVVVNKSESSCSFDNKSRRSSSPAVVGRQSESNSTFALQRQHQQSLDEERWRRRRQSLRRSIAADDDTTATSKNLEEQQIASTTTFILPDDNNHNNEGATVIVPLCNFHRQQVDLSAKSYSSVVPAVAGSSSSFGFTNRDFCTDNSDACQHRYTSSSYADVVDQPNSKSFGHISSSVGGNYMNNADEAYSQQQHITPFSLSFSDTAAASSSSPNPNSIVQKYSFFMQKSNSAWQRLRQMPLATPPNDWHQTFLRCFEMYNWLWKVQHRHRHELRLSRWQVGELARKIAQLYFNFYVRTSETDFLQQAFKFYNAIRERDYFEWRSFCYYSTTTTTTTSSTQLDQQQTTSRNDDDNADRYDNKQEAATSRQVRQQQHLKVLRYLCRFVVTCVLLKKMRIARQVLAELELLIDSFCYWHSAADNSDHNSINNNSSKHEQQKWQQLLESLHNFLANDQLVNVFPECRHNSNSHNDNNDNKRRHRQCSVVLRHRLIHAHPLLPLSATYQQQSSNISQEDNKSQHELSPAAPSPSPSTFFIEQAVICGNTLGQIRFGELQADMFRFMQTLEWEPSGSAAHLHTASGATSTTTSSTTATFDSEDAPPPTTTARQQAEGAVNQFDDTSYSSSCNIRVRAAPRKYMLLQPTFSLFMTTMSHAFNELTPTGILLLYFSCDSVSGNNTTATATAQHNLSSLPTDERRTGCLLLSYPPQQNNLRTTHHADNNVNLLSSSSSFDDNNNAANIDNNIISVADKLTRNFTDYLYPTDLSPFMRKPLFLVVDSSAGETFRQHLLQQQEMNTNYFALLASSHVPPAVAARLGGVSDGTTNFQDGRLLTLFLLSPCTALTIMCSSSIPNETNNYLLPPIPLERWLAALACSHDVLQLLSEYFDASQATCVQQKIFADTFGRLLLLRFVFMQYACDMHVDFVCTDGSRPTCVPELPASMYGRDDIRRRICDCVRELSCCNNSDQIFYMEEKPVNTENVVDGKDDAEQQSIGPTEYNQPPNNPDDNNGSRETPALLSVVKMCNNIASIRI